MRRYFNWQSSVSMGLVALFSVQLSAFAKEYKIDGKHTNIGFVARHMVSKVNGEFKVVDGEFSFDPAKPGSSKVTATVDAKSIYTNEEDRDKHLKGADFFDVGKYPTLKYVSTDFQPSGEGKFKMMGKLTLHGVTKPVEFEVEYLGETNDPWGSHRAGFTATSKINRKDYGINFNKVLDNGGLMVGDEIVINLNIEGVEKKEATSKNMKKL